MHSKIHLSTAMSLISRRFLILAMLVSPFTVFAQDEGTWQEASSESHAYHKARLRSSVPPYGLEKINSLIKTVPSAGDYGESGLNTKKYMALSLREKFTYHMIFPEYSSQNCDVMPPIIDEEKKISGHLPDVFSEANWSKRQIDFMVSNRDTVLSLIRESVNRSKKMGLNYKTAIVEVNGREMIPFIINLYLADHKDHDLLTVLMLLMKKNEYPPFISSTSFKKLYGKDSDYQSFINYNKENEELIISRAQSYYNGIR